MISGRRSRPWGPVSGPGAAAIALSSLVVATLLGAVPPGPAPVENPVPTPTAAPSGAADIGAVFCPACGARNRGGARFCFKDGLPLPVIDPSRYVPAFVPVPEALPAEAIRARVHESSKSVVRIRVKTSTPVRFPFTREAPSGYARVGRLEVLDESKIAGSGFVVSATGEIVTNAHVAIPYGVQGAISIELPDGRSAPARLLGADPASDLALLSAPGLRLPALGWADSDELLLGQETWAIGNARDIGISVTRGTIATRLRTRAGANQVESYVHSDAFIIGGNSGGPLVDAHGRVVGVSDVRLGAAKGQGYSIASNTARLVVDRLRKHGRYERGFLGLHVSQVDASAIRRFLLRVKSGVVVESVLPDTPAAAAGFQRGDVLFGINGRQATGTYVLQEAISSVGPGKRLLLTLDRDGKTIELPATTALRPDEPRIDPILNLENHMMVRFEEEPRGKGVIVRVPNTFSPAPRLTFTDGSVIESALPAQDWPEEPITLDYFKRKSKKVPVSGLADLRAALRRAYLGGRIGIVFELRRPIAPVAAAVYDETWPIVL